MVEEVMCKCCLRCTPRNRSVLFFRENYDFNNDLVSAALSENHTASTDGARKYLCVSCHRQLCSGKMPRFAVANNQVLNIAGLCYNNQPKRRRIDFSYIPNGTHEGNMDLHIEANNNIQMDTENIEVDTETSESIEVDTETTDNTEISEIHYEEPQYNCTCCHRLGYRRNIVKFQEQNYSVNNTLVQKALSYRLKDQSVEYICKTCHRNL